VGYARSVRFASTVALWLLGIALTHCSKDKAHEAAPLASSSASLAGSGTPEPGEDAVQSVYPLEAGPPDPLVVKLCQVLHDLPEQRRATCCDQKPAVVFTSECVRTLTSAVRFKAVSLDPVEVDRCAAAMGTAHDGCDWVGPWPPETPRECEGIVHGKLAVGARCRSSLECTEGLRCHGAGPTSPGLCGLPHGTGDACGAAVDTLAVFTKQSRADETHPECQGACDHLRCAPLVPLGGACRSARQCGDAGCAAGKCAPHVIGKVGEPCPTGECEEGLRCSGGACIARKPSGAPCKGDFECSGACIKTDGGATVCGRRCDVR
jgi:hypothetical protein